jgi:U4/U6 small nuclear ribonucleoprotein PRP31
MRTEVDEKIAKWQEPQQAQTKKALPKPDDRPSKKRGGKRARKYKEKFGMTETRKEVNRTGFANFSGEYGESAMGSDLGMLGSKAEGGKLRLPQQKEQKQAAKKMKRAIQMSSGATNGLSSSLVFTPVHGIELVGGDTMASREAKVKEANQKWFAQNSGFLSARPV